MISGGAGGSPPAPVTRMARYEHLPIYKKAMDLTVYAEKVVRKKAMSPTLCLEMPGASSSETSPFRRTGAGSVSCRNRLNGRVAPQRHR